MSLSTLSALRLRFDKGIKPKALQILPSLFYLKRFLVSAYGYFYHNICVIYINICILFFGFIF